MDRDSFKFNLRRLIDKAKKFPLKTDGITVSLPLVSINVTPDRVERDVAREVVIRLADKRVLNAWECCDGCIKNAMGSIQEIRAFLVDMQVKLKDKTDTALYLLIEFMLEGVRQFLTYTEANGPRLHNQDYFDTLNVLRPHLYRCLSQVAIVANMEVPTVPTHMRFDLNWDERLYMKDPTTNQPRREELPTSNVVPLSSGNTDRQMSVIGDGNVVAGGDISVSGGIHISPTRQVENETDRDYLQMFPDKTGEVIPDDNRQARIKNTSKKRTAKDCHGYMTKISIGGVWEDVPRLPLIWTGVDDRFVAIPPGGSRNLDIVVIHKRGDLFIIGRPTVVNTKQAEFKREIPIDYDGIMEIQYEVFDSMDTRGTGTCRIHFRKGHNPSVAFVPGESSG